MKFTNNKERFWLIVFSFYILLLMAAAISCSPYWYWKTDLPQANIRLYYSNGSYEDFPIHHVNKIKVTTYDVEHVKVEWEGIKPL